MDGSVAECSLRKVSLSENDHFFRRVPVIGWLVGLLWQFDVSVIPAMGISRSHNVVQ